jgi:hypothetical protein
MTSTINQKEEEKIKQTIRILKYNDLFREKITKQLTEDISSDEFVSALSDAVLHVLRHKIKLMITLEPNQISKIANLSNMVEFIERESKELQQEYLQTKKHLKKRGHDPRTYPKRFH